MLSFICKASKPFRLTLDIMAPIGDLIIRAYLFKVFFFSGLTKITSWQSTLALFDYEYQVPLIPPHLAAVIGTAAELILPVLILLGLLGRLPALCLFIFNIITVMSYPFLFTDDGQAGLHQHIHLGLLCMVLMLHGPGKLALDSFLTKFYCKSKG